MRTKWRLEPKANMQTTGPWRKSRNSRISMRTHSQNRHWTSMWEPTNVWWSKFFFVFRPSTAVHFIHLVIVGRSSTPHSYGSRSWALLLLMAQMCEAVIEGCRQLVFPTELLVTGYPPAKKNNALNWCSQHRWKYRGKLRPRTGLCSGQTFSITFRPECGAAKMSHAAVVVVHVVPCGCRQTCPPPNAILEYGWQRALDADKSPCFSRVWLTLLSASSSSSL